MRHFASTLVLWLLAVSAAAPFSLPGAGNSIDDLRGLVLNNAKIPVFNKARLQMMIFASRAERRGDLMIGFETVLEIIRSGANADIIDDGWGLRLYPLGAPLETVFGFWRERIRYSEGVMTTAECEIDQAGRRAGGNGKVFFRSPMLDLNGVGFEADFNRRTIAVNSQVNIVIRQSSASPEALLKNGGRLPEKYEYITASGDSMLIDSERREVMLIGNVRVDEERAFLTCDRLTVFWGGEKTSGTATAGDTEFAGAGVTRILADGEVVITKKENAAEQAFADHLICDVPGGTIKLSGDSVFPRLVSARGEVVSGKNILFERATRRGLITGGCRIEGAPETGADGKKAVRQILTSESGFFDGINNYNDFTGKVRMQDGDRTLECDRMRLITANRDTGEKSSAGASASLLGTEALAATGSKELKNAEFYGNVVLNDALNSKLYCYEMHAEFLPGKTPGGILELSRAKCFRNIRLENGGAGGAAPGVLTADRSELDYIGDRVTFEGNVKGRRENATLDCDKLDLYLGKRLRRDNEAPAGSAAIGTGSDKTLKKAVASGKVHVTDASGTLDCNRLSLFFTELPPGARPTPGMFQSGGVRLTDILADGDVVAVNRASAAADGNAGIFSGRSSGERVLKADHGRANLVQNVSHFTGDVSVNDRENQVLCNEMFVYGVNHHPEPQIPGVAPPEDPDADPFALPGFTEDLVPSAINLTDEVRLRRVLCLGDVRLTRTDPVSGRKQEAGGDRCDYLAEERTVTLTDTAPRRPWLRAEGRQQYCSKVVYDLGKGIFRSFDTDTFTMSPQEK